MHVHGSQLTEVIRKEKRMRWIDLVQRDDLVGGDIETQEDGEVFRGPIKSVTLEGDCLVIDTEWLALKQPGKTGWHVYVSPFCSATRISLSAPPPQDIGEGRILFTLRMCAICTIFPRGGGKLEPSVVEGLT